jgi:two-component system, chemotaxis family, response regulator Rcp1
MRYVGNINGISQINGVILPKKGSVNDRNFRILLVDDDTTDRELFIDVINLVGKGYDVAEAAHGGAALEYLQQASVLPNLIILDLNMPVKDGRETLKELKSHAVFKSIPVCIMSTSSAHFDVQFAYDEGACLFLVKPLEYKEMIEMLTSLLTLFNKHVTLIGRKK